MLNRAHTIPMRYLGIFSQNEIPADTVDMKFHHKVGQISYYICWASA